METTAAAVLGLVSLLELGLFYWMVSTLARQRRVEHRLVELAGALLLLTETAEAGFTANGAHIGRLVEALAPAPRRSPQRRGGDAAVSLAADSAVPLAGEEWSDIDPVLAERLNGARRRTREAAC